MATTYALLLTENTARRLQVPVPEVDVLLLERTLIDPPRAAATGRWAASLSGLFPNAELAPYVWHLISHGPDDGLRDRSSRSLSGPPHAFGSLQDTPEVAQAWDAMQQCLAAMSAKRIVLRTPASITPGALGRKRLAAFVAARKAEGLDVIWEPQGLWTPDEAVALAAEIGATLLHPAFEGGRPIDATLDGAWLRADASGRNPHLSPDQLDWLFDLEGRTLVFGGSKGIANLKSARDG